WSSAGPLDLESPPGPGPEQAGVDEQLAADSRASEPAPEQHSTSATDELSLIDETAVHLEKSSHPEQAEAPYLPPTQDDVLRDIYARETGTHVATVRAYLQRESGLPEPHAIPEEVYRACHTLSGSSKMAQARHGIRLAEPLDHWLRRVYSSGAGLQKQDLTLLADCMTAMETVASHLDETTGYFQNHWLLLERIAQAEKSLDARISEANKAAASVPAPSAA